MSYITTFTGKHFDPVHVDTDLIDLRDIAHALSMLCRANGHTRYFFSVAQHSINCCREARARDYTGRVQYACLLHDAAEAYLSDVTRPVKAALTAYQETENHLLPLIWEKYLGSALTPKETRQVFAIDDLMLSYEFYALMPETISGDYAQVLSEPDIRLRSQADVEAEFLALCREMGTPSGR